MGGILPDAPLASREKRAKGKGATKRGKNKVLKAIFAHLI